jgi:hypothetical protein
MDEVGTQGQNFGWMDEGALDGWMKHGWMKWMKWHKWMKITLMKGHLDERAFREWMKSHKTWMKRRWMPEDEGAQNLDEKQCPGEWWKDEVFN